MATLRIASFHNNAVILEADYHDGNRRVQVARCINNTSMNILLIVADGENVIYDAVLPPGTTSKNISQGKIVVSEEGTVDLPYGITVGVPSWR